MTEFSINKATRIMRAGDEFSKTNQKLKEAVWAFIEWLHGMVGDHGLQHQEIGWIIEKTGPKQIRLSVYTDKEGWVGVVTNSDKASIDQIITLCQAIAGPEMERLTLWLDEQVEERKKMAENVELAMKK